MELIQIVRDQKLINFDYKLVDFISEADEEVKYIDKKGKSQTMAVAPALRIKDPKHPARIAAEKLRGAEDEPDTTDAVGDKETKVSIDDEKREKINNFSAEIGLKRSKADPDVFVDEDDNDCDCDDADETEDETGDTESIVEDNYSGDNTEEEEFDSDDLDNDSGDDLQYEIYNYSDDD